MMHAEMAEGSSGTKAARGEAGTTLATRDSHLRRASRRRYALSITLALALEACLGLGLMLAGGKRWGAGVDLDRPLWVDLGSPAIGEGPATSQGGGGVQGGGPRPSPKRAAPIPPSASPGSAVTSPAIASPPKSAQNSERADDAPPSKLPAPQSPPSFTPSTEPGPAAPIAEASGTGSGSGGGIDASSRVASELAAFIESHKSYPETARRRGTEGTTRLAISIDAAGRLLSIRSIESSGSALLDAAAEALLRSAFPLEESTGERLEISIAVRYVLTRR
ncbi:MAG TPA: TonB family protein [Rectinemataceae bacterium]|nr:TonB family protein [Rectinemataceae bacterium]